MRTKQHKLLRAIRAVPLLARLALATSVCGAASFATAVSYSTGGEATAADEASIFGGDVTVRRLNEAQYSRSIHAIFGSDITIPGRFEPPLREEGLLAIGEGKVTISSLGFEQYELRARQIASQVFADDRRQKALGCAPATPSTFDRGCASDFLAAKGKRLFRRPLTGVELAMVTDLAEATTKRSGNFYRGVQAGIARLLVSPYFLFRVEQSVPDRRLKVAHRLDDYSLATRLSFFLWDAPPDEELLAAAEKGSLARPEVLQQQVDRMLASPQFVQGVRSYFEDMLGFDEFRRLSKDQVIYPKFSTQLARDAKEQTLLTIIDLLVTHNGDYRDLFTTKKTFLSRNLAALYKVKLPAEGFSGMVPYTFSSDDGRAGILTLAAFLMLDPTHEGRSSPTIRGMTVRQMLLCQKVPVPPANVNFAVVQDVNSPQHKTARERLTAHMESPACAGCHALTDPIGLGMENYDGLGSFRTHENGALIDASGTFEGEPYTGLLELSRLLRDSPSIPECAVQRVYEYGVGRQATTDEQKWLALANRRFANNGFVFNRLMRDVALSQPFRTASVQQTPPAQKLASK